MHCVFAMNVRNNCERSTSCCNESLINPWSNARYNPAVDNREFQHYHRLCFQLIIGAAIFLCAARIFASIFVKQDCIFTPLSCCHTSGDVFFVYFLLANVNLRLKFSVIFLRHLLPWPSTDIQVKFYGDVPAEPIHWGRGEGW